MSAEERGVTIRFSVYSFGKSSLNRSLQRLKVQESFQVRLVTSGSVYLKSANQGVEKLMMEPLSLGMIHWEKHVLLKNCAVLKILFVGNK